jgi:hypothetical protein
MLTLKITVISLILVLLLYSCNKNEFAPQMVDQEFSVEENSAAGTIFGVLEAHDRDECQLLTFDIIDGNDEGIFKIDPSNGILSVDDPTLLDYESITQVILTISVSDCHKKNPMETSAKVIINIINVHEGYPEEHLELHLQPDGDSGKDAVFGEIVPDNNYANLEDIHLYAWTHSGAFTANRVALDFDLSSIPPGAIIYSAYLSLFFNHTSEYGNEHVGETGFFIQRITSDWDESTVTWNTKPTTTTVNRVWIDGATQPYQDFPEIDITALIQDYTSDRDNSYGIFLKLVSEDPYKILLLASSDHQNESIRPKLDVYYTIID